MEMVAVLLPMLALVGEPRVKVKLSRFSCTLLSVIAMRTVRVVSPAAKISAPDTAVASALFDIVALPL